MPIIKIQNKLSGDNKGSSAASISYLEKEQKFRDKNMRFEETFFNQNGTNFKAKEVVKKLDSNRQGLKKTEAKYFSLTIAPSQKELKFLSDDNLKEYANDFMKLYAAQFGRDIDPIDLVWFGKLEHTRKYKGFQKGKSDKLPPGKKAGQFKPGDQRHIHILVRRKTEKNVKLSPLANAKNSSKGFGTKTKMGFDRVDFFQKCDILMHKKLEELNNGFKPGANDFFGSRYIESKNYDFKKAKQIGIMPEVIVMAEKWKAFQEEQIEKAQKELSSEEKIELAVKVHSEKYPGKIPNISYNPEHLNKELQKKFDFQLTKEEIKIVHDKTKELSKEQDKGMSL